MCVSPGDGRMLVASGSDDNTVRVWDVASCEALPQNALSMSGLLWSSRSQHQPLDCRGSRLLDAVGLTESQMRLLEHNGASRVMMLRVALSLP